jgi:hypothetical protein
LKKLFAIFLFLSLFKLTAQNPDSTIRVFFPDNRYGPAHQIIKDSIKKTVSDVGHYISAGVGGGHAYGIGGLSAIFSYSIAYKSLIFTLTRAGSSVFSIGEIGRNPYYTASYFGFLMGQTVRYKHFMMSLSVGVAGANIAVTTPDPNQFYGQINYNLKSVVSVPVEFKAFVLANNGIGFGIHFAENMVSPLQYSPFYFGFSLVTGYWNKLK